MIEDAGAIYEAVHLTAAKRRLKRTFGLDQPRIRGDAVFDRLLTAYRAPHDQETTFCGADRDAEWASCERLLFEAF
ncbi:hypothetical protein PO124_02705 [Bacillus licheniformis]|nr:hypothetical protein [Bacillus licheniformis]